MNGRSFHHTTTASGTAFEAGPAAAYPKQLSLAQLFEQQAASSPEAIAVVCDGLRWSYRELNERANFIAEKLVSAGVSRDGYVAVLLDRSPMLIASLLGILKAGGAYMPLSPGDPAARWKALLADARPRAIIAESSLAQGISNFIDAASFEGRLEANPAPRSSGNDLCYLLFSSGSTGQPKGVMVEHHSVARLVRNSNFASFGPEHTFLHLAPLAFDASTFEIWGALLNGGRLAVMPAGPCSLADIAAAIGRYNVTTLWLTAGLFAAMVDSELESLTRLNQLLTGGDVVSPRHAARLLAAAPGTKLINGYGPTEGTTFTCCYTIPAGHAADQPIPIGSPIANTSIVLVDEQLRPVTRGEAGEILIAGDGVARGYLNSPELTAAKFIDFQGERAYRSGDLGRLTDTGVIEFLGRADDQVKLRGFRIEPGEIECVLRAQSGVESAAVIAVDAGAEKQLRAFYTGRLANEDSLRRALAALLPAHMIPARFTWLEAMPLTANGKVDRKALASSDTRPKRPAIDLVRDAWQGVLGSTVEDLDRAFFDLGGSSLQLMRVHSRLEREFGRAIAIADLFRFPTVRGMAAFLSGTQASTPAAARTNRPCAGIAIVGMAARLPGARNTGEFWNNLKSGVESIRFFKPEELEAGNEPGYVGAKSVLDGAEMFDAAYFGILPKEAASIDPQQRVFLECCVEALEDAGCDPARFNGSIGVFAGSSPNTYFLHHICSEPGFLDRYTGGYQVENYTAMLGTSPDFLATRVSYKLNLTGPAISMSTACSTSLIAVTQACESLLSGSSDAALAGGVSITFPQNRGYRYQEGGIVSPDGHCRPFDADARGTVFGSGCGVVLLKRLEDAIESGDPIYAVIKGYGINNDGSVKAAFTAPSVEGQAAAIRRAHQMAGIDPASIGYVEAHGTATPLGDPIEVAGLTLAFGGNGGTQHCGLGTAKGNVGHLDAASGVTGLIKAALSVKHGVLAPTLHYRRPNPAIEFEKTPFYVVDRLTQWNSEGPRRAGVSAFGVGGTNAHLVLEQFASPEKPETTEPPCLLVLSAKTESALNSAAKRVADALESDGGLPLAGAAWTLQTGRAEHRFRRAVTAQSRLEAIAALREPGSKVAVDGKLEPLPLIFAFPGQGSHQALMGRELYRDFAVYRTAVDECAEQLKPHTGRDIREILFTPEGAPMLDTTLGAQPGIFVTEYALAQLWKSLGIRPEAMIGHSLGEFVAATEAGVFELADALEAIAVRARLMQSLPGGAMLAVRLPEAELAGLVPPGAAIATVNSPNACVVAGPEDVIAGLAARFDEQKIASRRLRTSHAFHSPMMEPVVAPLGECISKFRLSAPRIPIASTLTGEWMTAEQATSVEYWTRHCVEPVLFSRALRFVQAQKAWCLLESGPGTTLSALAQQHGSSPNRIQAVSSIGDAPKLGGETAAWLASLARVWMAGASPEWRALYQTEPQKVSLPAYPFEHKRYVIERQSVATLEETQTVNQLQQAAESGRTDRLRGELIALLTDLSGIELDGSAAGASFLELGFDSLFLTQVSQRIDNQYKCKVKFADLLGELSTVNRLAAHIDSVLPADVAPAPPKLTAVSAPAPVPAPAVTTNPAVGLPDGAGAIERLLQEQLRSFNELASRQLEVLRGGTAAAPAASVAAAPAAPAAAAERPAPKFEAFGPYKPIQKNISGELTARQSEYLAAFIERYNARTKGSKLHTQQHRAALADPRVASGFRAQWKEIVYPIVIERSSGSRLWDIDGNEYIDLLNGFGVTMFGHAPRFVREAVAEQLERGFEIGPQTPLAGRVAELLCELTGNERATFCNTGSEAVMAAMRLARTVTGRDKVVFFAGDYHGSFDEVLMKRAGAKSRPIAPGIPVESAANIIVLDYGTPEALEFIRAHADELAAVMVEPVQSRHCDLQPRDFLREVREITEKSGAALVFDEVVTGFRTHPGGAQALFGIRADLATYGKVIGGGLPIGALAGKARFMDALDGGMWSFGNGSSPEAGVTFFAGTFVRHPLAMAAAWSVLNHVKAAGPELQENLSRKTGRLVAALNDLFESNGVPTHVENFRSIFYFGFGADQRLASLLYYHLRDRGVHIQEGFPCFLTTAHSDADIDQVIDAFRDSIAAMQSGGLLPAPPTSEPVECPLTEAQMEIRLSAQMGDEESCAFNEGFAIRFEGDLNVQALRRAVDCVVARHESLRATLSASGDRLLIHPRLKIDLPVVDLTAMHASLQDERIAALRDEDARTPFDLVRGPLVRMRLAKLAAAEHLLLVTAHHIICDGWTIGIFLDELGKLYAGFCSGQTVALAEPHRFSDYARTTGTYVDPKVEAYWVSEFAQPSPALELPLDRARPALKSYRGATLVSKIGADVCSRVRKAGARQGSTLFSSLLANFQLLLARLSGQNDIVVGVPSAGQSACDSGPLAGHCVNFLPIRIQIPEDASFASLLSESRRKLMLAQEHGSYTYGTLVRKLALPRDPSRLPLIEVQFNLEKTGARMEFGNLQASVDQSPKCFVNFDLFLNLVESGGGLTLYCDYNTDLFDEATVARWLAQYETLLETASASPEAGAWTAPLLGAAEREEIIETWNATGRDYPQLCAHQLFEQRAIETPQAVAVRCDDRALTYAELDRAANQLAWWLKSRGAQPGELIGISLEPSIEMLVAVLGVLKSGAAYLPLDPDYPAERLDYIRRDAGVKLTLDAGSWPGTAALPAAHPPAPAIGELAYVIYTSGSTGNPKGVEIEHRALTNLLCTMCREPGIAPSDKLLAVTTLSFDIAGLELLAPLTQGAEVVIAPREVKTDGRRLAGLIASSAATVMQATPTTWRMLIDAGWAGSPALKMLCGGEELTRDLAAQLISRGASLWNMYGPTETTIWSSTVRVADPEAPVTIGRPIANTQFYILDARRNPVPQGVAGALWIGGDGLARGYRNQPAMTADKFVANPFRPGERMYITGDLARFLPDGQVQYLGRMDRQIKLRGHRMELGEIEEALAACPLVRDAAVIVREDRPGDKRLVAYIVPARAAVDEVQLRDLLGRRLPAYMVPAHFVGLDVMPLTANRKIDRLALGSMPAPAAAQNEEYREPRNHAERTLASIVQDVLKVKRASIDDDFFSLGADSIHLFQIAARAAHEGLELAPRDLLRNRTVAAAVAALNGHAPQSPVSKPGIKAASREAFRLKRNA